MPIARFNLDPDRVFPGDVFPGRAYTPGYEPTLPEAEPPADMLPGGDIIGFIAAAGLMTGALAIVSFILLWF